MAAEGLIHLNSDEYHPASLWCFFKSGAVYEYHFAYLLIAYLDSSALADSFILCTIIIRFNCFAWNFAESSRKTDVVGRVTRAVCRVADRRRPTAAGACRTDTFTRATASSRVRRASTPCRRTVKRVLSRVARVMSPESVRRAVGREC